MKIITGPDVQPMRAYPVKEWGRSLDPWHRDAFPVELQDQIPDTGRRREGWMGYDWVGNPIVFVADGTEIETENRED
jgi:hypothetical protein